MAGPITAAGYLHSDFGNYLTSTTALGNFRDLHALAYPGGLTTEETADGPWLGAQKYLDLGLDPTFTTDSTTAIDTWLEDCNALRKPGWGMLGVFIYDPADPPVLMNGAGFVAPPSGFTLNFDDDFTDLDPRAGTGMVFAKPYSANKGVPVFVVHRGACVLGFPVVWYSDVVDRFTNGDFTIGGTYPNLTGGPDRYAPTFVTDHIHADSGADLPTGRNANPTIEAIVLGGDTGVYLGDPDPAVETHWASADYSSGNSKGVAGFNVKLKGWCNYRGVVVERCGNTNDLDILLSPGFWTEASQLEDPLLIQWPQRNGKVIEASRKWVGSTTRARARQMRYGLYCANRDAQGDLAAGASGQDGGKIANHDFDFGFESIPTAIFAGSKTFLHGNNIRIRGHLHDPDDNNCTDPALDIQTDTDLAGTIDKQSGLFKSMTEQGNGWSNYIWLNLQETTGPLFRNTSADVGTWIFDGPRVSGWGQGSKLTLSLIENNSENVIIDYRVALSQCSDNASKRVFAVPDATVGDGQKLFVRPCQMAGVTTLVVGETDWAGCDDGVFIDPDAVTGSDDDEGGDE